MKIEIFKAVNGSKHHWIAIEIKKNAVPTSGNWSVAKDLEELAVSIIETCKNEQKQANRPFAGADLYFPRTPNAYLAVGEFCELRLPLEQDEILELGVHLKEYSARHSGGC